jgi:hypothetical protein
MEHIDRISSGRLPKEILKCQPEGNVSFIKTSEMAEGFFFKYLEQVSLGLITE